MAADEVGHKRYGEPCPWLYGRGLTGRRTAAGSSVSVGVPSGKKRAFVAATNTAGIPKAEEKLHEEGSGEGYRPQHLLRRHLRPQRNVLHEKGSRRKDCLFV